MFYLGGEAPLGAGFLQSGLGEAGHKARQVPALAGQAPQLAGGKHRPGLHRGLLAVPGPGAANRYRLDGQPLGENGLAVFHPQGGVGQSQGAGSFRAQQGLHGPLPPGGKGQPRLVLKPERLGKVRGEQRLGQMEQQRRVRDLAAKIEMGSPQGPGQGHAPGREALGPGAGPGEGQLRHQIRSGLQGALGPGPFIQHGGGPPLKKVAAHDAANRRAFGPGFFQKPQMPPVKGVKFTNNRRNCDFIRHFL